ncbi:putative ferric reductase FRE2 precursor [Rosellinia necatrix]|uniref:Putative ferric reductase FRE2 n=1 Tax=Rosellinia necatrix TaxID=77044 RepID=A0A1W2TQ19_ROSNE|nr:putative ferric reductase FRE2 precursor [Rosellinia necatrix]
MTGPGELLASRHIQNESEADYLEPHWGYVARVRPCTNDAGSCEYLDQVYYSHDLSMLYSGILWATILGIIFVWTIVRKLRASSRADGLVPGGISARDSSTIRSARAFSAYVRGSLLPDAARPIFGRTTRLQVLILVILAGYLLVWSFAGITYKIWITPVKNNPGLYNTRSSLGPFSDRIGVLAYALTPLSVLLSTRESILSLLTGVPYQSFNFMHRWLGYIIFIQSSVHTIGWTIIEVRLYQPQPSTAIAWIVQPYIIWGVVAMILLLLLVGLSTPWAIRLTGYEFFRKAHYVLALVYIGACWGHWEQLKCFLLPSILIWFLDRAIRLLRTALIHHQYLPDGSMGFRPAPASLTHFPDAEHGDVVRMDFTQPHDAWKIGQHFYLCFAESSIWQSHPFTPLNLPQTRNGSVTHSYIFRAKKGETKKVADLTVRKLAGSPGATTPVILTGPYGESIVEALMPDDNLLCVAGGTGITYVLPVLLDIIQKPAVRDRKIQLVWAIRRKADLCWVEQEILAVNKASRSHGIEVHIFVTREASGSASSIQEEKLGGQEISVKETCSSSSCSSDGSQAPMSLDIQKLGSKGLNQHPDLSALVSGFVDSTVRGPTRVFGSGPGGMISDLRSVVAVCNSGAKVWRGNERFDVSLICDDRLEW